MTPPSSSPPPTGPRWGAILFGLAVLAAVLALAWAVQTGRLLLSDDYNPWASLDVAAEPNFLTRLKLRRAAADDTRCRAALAQAGLRYEPVPDRVTGPGCGFENAVRIGAGRSLTLGAPVVLSCRAALAFAMWERHALQPVALRRLGTPIASLEHLGSYACRNVNTGEGGGIASGRRSRHASADAIDVAGFTTADRRRISVRRDWQPAAQADALFLRDAHAGACRFFDGVLGPDYNAVHADHFHVEVGGWGLCR